VKNKVRTALVTGGAGFIGSHLADRLLHRGHKVVVFDDLSGGFLENIPKEAFVVEGTILDISLLSEIFNQYKFDAIFHMAAYAAEGLSPFIRRFNYENNLIGSINLINLSIKHEVDRFIYASSIAVYGSNQLPMEESLIPRPEDPYGIAKLSVEMDLRCAKDTFGLPYTVFRPHNVYGEYQNIGDPYRNVIGIFFNKILRKEPLTIFGDGEQKRAFSYVDDVVFPMVDCLEIPQTIGEVFNVGADQFYTINELAKAVMRAFGVEVPVKYLDARSEVVDAYADHTKAKKMFPCYWRSLSLEEGLDRMATWVKKVGPRETTPFSNIELTTGLPSSWQSSFN
jgi:UDP-glucose 4-epimerase